MYSSNPSSQVYQNQETPLKGLGKLDAVKFCFGMAVTQVVLTLKTKWLRVLHYRSASLFNINKLAIIKHRYLSLFVIFFWVNPLGGGN